MSLKQLFLIFGLSFGAVLSLFGKLPSRNLPDPYTTDISLTSPLTDTIPLLDRKGDYITDKQNNPFDITTKEINQKVEFDPATGNYIIMEKIGDQYYRTPTYMTFDEYMDYMAKEQERKYFNTLAGIKSDKKSRSGKIDPMDKIDLQNSLIDRLFGGTEVNIQPQGSVDLSVGWLYSRRDDPQLPIQAQRQSQPDFPTPLIKMNVDGKIGKKLDLGFNYDTQSTFDFDRQIKLAFDSDAFSEDDIIKKIEAGNVSLPLRGNLIQGAQSLFGLKTELQFGRLRLTALMSQQRSRANNIKVENGVSVQEFTITPNEYDENRHFFLSHYNRSSYERNLSNMPYIGTPHQIAQIEVWISDDRPEYQDNSTMVTAIADLGEPDATKFTSNPTLAQLNCQAKDDLENCLPRNAANDIYAKIIKSKDIVDIDEVARQLTGPEFNLRRTRDFEVFRGRRLSPSEYTFHPKLGTLSLNIRLRPNQVLGVAYNYYYTSNCDTLYQVGQLSASSVQPGSQTDTTRVEPPKVFFVKLLKSTNQTTTSPMWDLMMKNVYNLRTSQLNQQDFEFDVFYEDDFNDGSLKKYFPEDALKKLPLLQFFNLDRLNRFGDPQPDGYFDYIPGVTVIERSGSIVFPILEPFGSHISVDALKNALGVDQLNIDENLLLTKYRYQELYDTSISIAAQNLTKNKFRMNGKVKSSANNGEIPLGPFVPQGSVRVSAGGKQLVEGQDYEIDYSLGRLRIINPTYLAQGTPIDVSFEDNSLFSLQQKNMLGLRAEYQFSKKSSLGATYLRLYERPFTQKVNIGDDPINNRIFGLDYNYNDEAPWVTKLIDKLPFYSTKEKSNINLTAEVAGIIPGHSKAINIKNSDPNVADDSGIANIDDFEGAITNLNLGGFNYNQWSLASTPSTSALSNNLFPEAEKDNSLAYGANRAKLNWYVLDLGTRRTEQDNINPYTRTVRQTELFTNRQVQPGQQQLFTFDLSYYPSERGPYNFEKRQGYPGVSSGFTVENNQIKLNDPERRWGGIMRYFQNSDFEAANYESIEFWMLNPFMDRQDGSEGHPDNEEGEIIFNLGSVSEDIIRDNFLYFENALPTTQRKVPTTGTTYGRATVSIPLVNGFDLREGNSQDLGFDGLNNEGELSQFQSWLIENNVANLNDVAMDPANDDFLFFNDNSLENEPSLLNRMKKFNGPEGNAPLNNSNTNEFIRGNRYPDTEDINNNKSLDQTEAFYEYKIKIKKLPGTNELDTSILGNHFRQTTIVKPPNRPVEKWYRFQVPIAAGVPINGISGYRAIQFMRMYMTNFKTPKTFRLADFQLQRSQWRKQKPICEVDGDPNSVEFSIDDVGVEENSGKLPFNYVTPKGVVRTQAFSTLANLLQDERSMVLKFKKLPKICEVSMTKLANVNLALYKRLQMFVHAERASDGPEIMDSTLSIVVRIGKDFDNSNNTSLKTKGANNYYEYELPLVMSKEMGGLPSQHTQENVWPNRNYINIPLDSLLELKRYRIRNNIPVRDTIEMMINPEKGDKIRMVGNPSLGAVKVFQVAIRNLKENVLYNGEVWVNEMRVTGFDESGGIAAQAKLQIQMADLGELNFSGNYSSIGFGALDKRLMERNREETIQYDVAANIDAGKILPKALQLSIPLYAQYQKTYITPQFDPFDQDLEVGEKLSLIEDASKRDSIREVAREEITIKTFNLTNIKTQAGGTGKPWSPSNLGLSYAYTENTKSDPIIKQDKTVQRSLGLDYVYSRKSTYIEPFKFIKVNALKLISDFNFSILPSNFSFTSRMINQDNSRTFRLPDTPVFIFDDKRFRWERNYVLDWDLTKSLRFNFRANSMSIIDQIRQSGIADTPEERDWFDRDGNNVTLNVIDDPLYPEKYRNQNLRNLGRSKNYNHNVSLNYKLPFKSIPILEWINAGADYKAEYGWDGGSLITIDDIGTPLGNTIRNGQNAGFNVTFDFSKLYSKSGYLKSIETGKAPRATRKKPEPAVRKNISDKDKTEEMSKEEDSESVASKEKKKTEKEDKPRDPSMAERVILRPLMLIRSVKFNYKDDRTTLIPGFMPQSKLLGQSEGFSAPGWDFIAGVQPRISGENNWLQKNQGWFNPSYNFNDALTQTKRQTFDAKLLIEPFKDFSVDVTFKKNYQESHTEVFRNKKMDGEDTFLQLAKYDVGSFDASFFAMNTLFDNSFGLYNQFKDNREIISRRLPNIQNPGVHPSDPSYAGGYGPSHNSVTVPAFIAAYTRQSAFDVELDQQKVFASNTYIPKPNWQLNYNGLSKLKMFKSIFSNITIKHGYISTIRVSNFQTSPNFNSNDPFIELSPNNNYYSRLEIPAVSIQEQFVPIIGISVKTVKDMKLDFEYKMTRNLELGITQLRENKSKEIVIGGGYIIKDVKTFSKKKKAKKKTKKDEEADPDADPLSPKAKPSNNRTSVAKGRDIRINFSYSLRDDISQIYDLLTGIDAQADRGSKTVTLNPTVEYDVNKNLALRFYFDYSKITPRTSLSFPVTTIRSGITLRFNIN
ncbi:MAG: cell surface protein SprA [Saprospiraceae bacterium]|nr:cell surface protein SprA [Saprospiraceae bacterium]